MYLPYQPPPPGLCYQQAGSTILVLIPHPVVPSPTRTVSGPSVTAAGSDPPEPTIAALPRLRAPPTSRQLPCPFYIHAPLEHPKCANKKFRFPSKLKSVAFPSSLHSSILLSHAQCLQECIRRDHISAHTLPYQCDRCNSWFSRPFVLGRHRRSICGTSVGARRLVRQVGQAALHNAMAGKDRVEDMVKVLEEWDC